MITAMGESSQGVSRSARFVSVKTRLHPAGQVARSAFFDHFHHFLHQYIEVLFWKIFTFLLKKGVQKWVPKNAPILR